MVDLAPTILQLAGSNVTALDGMDGVSFAAQLQNSSTWASYPRNAALIEYQALAGGPDSPMDCADVLDAFGFAADGTCTTTDGTAGAAVATVGGVAPAATKRITDGPTNSYSALRIAGASGPQSGLLYAEFVNVSDPAAWLFDPATINFYELYNMSADPFVLHNMCVGLRSTTACCVGGDMTTALQPCTAACPSTSSMG